MPGTDPTADDWASEARNHLHLARNIRAIHPRQAYISAGTAIEMALKCRIMRQSGMNRWPTRREDAALHTHNLAVLSHRAGLTDPIRDAMVYVADIGVAWVVAKDFSMERRYPDAPLAPRAVADMVAAAETLVPWILES